MAQASEDVKTWKNSIPGKDENLNSHYRSQCDFLRKVRTDYLEL